MSHHIQYFQFAMLYAPVLSGLLLWWTFGQDLVSDAYNGKSWGFLNRVISGQAVHPVDYYFQLADRLVWHAGALGLFLLIQVHIFVALNEAYRRKRVGLRGVCIAAVLCLASVFAPPIFSRLFALGSLRDGETVGLWITCGAVLLLAALIRWIEWKAPRQWGAVGFALVVLIAGELGVRACVKFSAVRQMELARIAEQTYPDTMRYRAHPFLHYTGVSRHALNQSGLSGADDLALRYNSMGFIGREFQYAKSESTFRIACLGGSTTESGYPLHLEEFLEGKLRDKSVDVLNFGIAAYSSGHSLVNFVLNVRDFAPDVVVLHDGWNDGIQRPISGANRGDYSLAYGPFSPRTPDDRYLIRVSVIYRWLRNTVNPRPDHIMLEGAMGAAPNRIPPAELQQEADRPDHGWTPFERNVRTIIELCRLDRRLCVLATMPYRTREQDLRSRDVVAIAANNGTLRRLAKEYAGTVVLADLDEQMTGQDDNKFRDVGHVTLDGDRQKSAIIGDVIVKWLEAKENNVTIDVIK